MSYRVRDEMPKSCYRCPFVHTKWYHPFWSASDKATKAQWCPLVEVSKED